MVVERERPKEWNNLFLGGRFMERWNMEGKAVFSEHIIMKRYHRRKIPTAFRNVQIQNRLPSSFRASASY
ncbi:hypothetical protein D9V96_005380 [Zobellia laminariae]|uniref:hypothetical protein n=1 Tax=Zobellia laminariae TaxID=248906 RepID=UPI0012D8CF52